METRKFECTVIANIPKNKVEKIVQNFQQLPNKQTEKHVNDRGDNISLVYEKSSMSSTKILPPVYGKFRRMKTESLLWTFRVTDERQHLAFRSG